MHPLLIQLDTKFKALNQRKAFVGYMRFSRHYFDNVGLAHRTFGKIKSGIRTPSHLDIAKSPKVRSRYIDSNC